MSAVEIARHDINVATGDERADAGAEWTHDAVDGARALGEKEQDVAWTGEKLTAKTHRMEHVRAPRKGQRVAEDSCDQTARATLKEVVARCGGEDAAQSS